MTEEIWVTRSAMPPMQEYIDEISALWDSRILTNMGVKHEQLRRALRGYLGVDRIDLLTNGHMALELSLQAMQLRGEVITTPFTFASTTHAIVRSGLTPVFCDIDAQTYTMDATRLEALITERTSAIVPVHVYGTVCDVGQIERIARAHRLKVIYDAAHAFGVTYRGAGVGSFGDAACFSFHATKVFHTIEGGAVCFREPAFGERLYQLKNFGIMGPERVEAVGANAKMNEFCAAMGLCNLRHIDEQIARRKQIDARYRRWLSGIPGVALRVLQPDVQSNYAYFPVRFDKTVCGCSRDEIDEALRRENIFPRKYFYPLTSAFSCYRGACDADKTPVAQMVSEQILALPLYPELPLDEVDRICRIVLWRLR